MTSRRDSTAERFCPDLNLGPPERATELAPLAAGSLTVQLRAARGDFQRGLLQWLKGDERGTTGMRKALALIETTQTPPHARALWWVGQGFLDAVSLGGIEVDAAVKRLGARIDAQIRQLAEASTDTDPGLLRELLFQVAISARTSPHIDSVRRAYRLAELPKPAVEDDAGPQDAQLQDLRALIALAREHWERFGGGLAAALPPFHEATARITTCTEQLGRTDMTRLAAALGHLANLLRKDPLAHDNTMASAVTDALSLLGDAIEHFADLGVDFAHRVDLIAGRLAALLRSAQLEAPEIAALDQERER